jgi:hypothetical protein
MEWAPTTTATPPSDQLPATVSTLMEVVQHPSAKNYGTAVAHLRQNAAEFYLLTMAMEQAVVPCIRHMCEHP